MAMRRSKSLSQVTDVDDLPDDVQQCIDVMKRSHQTEHARNIVAKTSDEIILLERSKEGVERFTLKCMVSNKAFVQNALAKFGPNVPYACRWRLAIQKMDKDAAHKISNLQEQSFKRSKLNTTNRIT